MPNCPKCTCEYTYSQGTLIVCPKCSFEWNPLLEIASSYKDVNGNILKDNDSVIVVKQLKVKGSSSGIKKGTKIKNIKLNNSINNLHNIDCKIDGIGRIEISSKYVKKL